MIEKRNWDRRKREKNINFRDRRRFDRRMNIEKFKKLLFGSKKAHTPGKNRIVITGIGVVAPNGTGKDQFWDNLIQGTSGIRHISLFKTDQYNSKRAGEIPDFDKIWIFAEAAYDNIALFDNFYIEGPGEEPQIWVRTMPMTCWRVWINGDNNFQFVFWYPYKNNNWVRIYDMEGNLVFETDMTVHDPNLIVDLPDGMYMVKPFHGLLPLQEFMIGKP